MTPEQLAAIKARAGALTPFVDAVENHPMQLTDTRPEVVDLLVVMTKTAQDVPVLLAEVERLGRLYHSVADEAARYDAAAIAAEVEVARLRAQVAAVEALCDEIEAMPKRPPRRLGFGSNRAKARRLRWGHGHAAALSLAKQLRAAIAEAGGAS